MAGGVRVLCVDDDSGFCELQSQFLERVEPSLDVDVLTDPAAALDRLDEAGDYECVVSDYDMPELSGLELFEQVDAAYPDLPFILHTGKGSEEIASEAISAGVTDYLQKGSRSEHFELLANRITEYVDRYRSERQRKRTEERYRRLVEQSVVGIGLSQDGTFEYCNPRFAEIFGYSTDELLGESVFTVIDSADRDRVERALDLRESGDVDSVHYLVTGVDKQGGQVELEVHGSQVVYDGEPAVLGIVQPLGVRHRAPRRGAASEPLPEIREQLEAVEGLLDEVEPDLPDVRRALADAVAAVDDGVTEPQETESGVVDVEAACQVVRERAGGGGPELSIRADHRFAGDQSVVEDLFEGLFEAWAGVDRSVEFRVVTTPDSFEVRIEPTDGCSIESPPDPPAISRIAGRLDADIYIARTDTGIIYVFSGLTSEP